MNKATGNNERIILIIMSVLAIAAGGWFISQSLSFAETLAHQKQQEKPFVGEIPVDRIERAISLAASDPMKWEAPVRAGKPVPLFKSVLLLLKYSDPENIIDMFTENVAIRPPMTNKWLRESNLPKIGDHAAFLIPNVGELDPDNDGFSNKEEFEKGTDPVNASSHPPATEKIFLLQRISHNNRLTLKSTSPPYQVATPDEKGKKNWFVNTGDRFGAGGRFVAGDLEKKVIPDPKVGEKDVSELKVEDTLRKTTFTLVNGAETNLPDYEAEFESRLKFVDRAKAMKGGNFRFTHWPDTTYKVIDIQEDSAVISPLKNDGSPDKEIVIKKN